MADEKIIFSMVGVSKTFTNQKKVLNNIYLSFFYGAKIGIIGLNGSGKSTLMKIIAGIDKNFQGEVVFSPGYSVGYLEQEPQLDPAKTVREVVSELDPATTALMLESDYNIYGGTDMTFYCYTIPEDLATHTITITLNLDSGSSVSYSTKLNHLYL